MATPIKLSSIGFLTNCRQHFTPTRLLFEDLKKKLFVAISNLNTGQAEIHSIGELHKIVQASACIPLIFKPIEIGNYTYVDGGLLNNLPVEPLLDISEVVIGVNVNGNNILSKENWNLKTIAERSFDLIMWTNASNNLNKCHIIIEPSETTQHNLFDFAQTDSGVFQNKGVNIMQYKNFRFEKLK